MKRARKRRFVNSLFYKITVVYSVFSLFMGFWGCYFSYSKEYNSITHRFEQAMSQMNYQYQSITDDFWRLYMPIFENPSSIYAPLRSILKLNPGESLSPMEKLNLTNALRSIMANDDRIRWASLYTGENGVSYILYTGSSSLKEMPLDFPFRDNLENKGPSMEIFETSTLHDNGSVLRSFALCGGVAPDIRTGNIIVGYESATLAPENLDDPQIANARFLLTNDAGIIYDSMEDYDASEDTVIKAAIQKPAGMHIIDGTIYFIQKYDTGTDDFSILCIEPWGDMFLQCISFTPVLVILVWICSLVIYHWTGRVIAKKTEKIQVGLKKIGCNELDYRISIPSEVADEFDSIGSAVNDVADRLQENIQKVYMSKLRQREAELSELQAKFDPHFLYNTLEVIRGRVYENGDEETADIVVKLAQIFRSFIGSDIFVPIREEINFCNLYLSLLRYRYDNRVKIVYDIDSDILDFGIVRNLLQPILENYFIHGFAVEKRDNCLTINGRMMDEKYIRFRIEDNGLGITLERLAEIKRKLEILKPSGKGSYGLNNINQRIVLFYGPDCGLEIFRNQFGGTTIDVRILKLSCEEHESRLSRDL